MPGYSGVRARCCRHAWGRRCTQVHADLNQSILPRVSGGQGGIHKRQAGSTVLYEKAATRQRAAPKKPGSSGCRQAARHAPIKDGVQLPGCLLAQKISASVQRTPPPPMCSRVSMLAWCSAATCRLRCQVRRAVGRRRVGAAARKELERQQMRKQCRPQFQSSHAGKKLALLEAARLPWSTPSHQSRPISPQHLLPGRP